MTTAEVVAYFLVHGAESTDREGMKEVARWPGEGYTYHLFHTPEGTSILASTGPGWGLDGHLEVQELITPTT